MESSSEDDINLLTFKEATNQDFLKNLTFNDKNNLIKINNGRTYLNDVNRPNINYKLFECHKEFVAKKLYERLEMEIILENNQEINCNQDKKISGIKLFTTSKLLLSKVNKRLLRFSKRINIVNDERAIFFKCKDVVMKSEKVLSECDTKYWVNRKPSKQFKYKQIKNGTLLKIV